MTTSSQGNLPKRVVCVLDSTAESRSSLDIVARLAAETGGELVALFVEDPELLDAAALSVTHLSAVGRRREPMDRNLLRRALSLSARRAESELTKAGTRWQVQTSFRRVTTLTRESMAAEAEQCQLIAMSQSRMQAMRAATGSKELLGSETHCSVLLSRREPGAHRPLAVLVEIEDEADDRIIDQALAIATAHRLPVRIYVGPVDGNNAAEHVAALQKRLSGNASVAGVIPLAHRDATSLEGALAREPASILLLSRQGNIGKTIDPSRLLSEKLATTVLLTA